MEKRGYRGGRKEEGVPLHFVGERRGVCAIRGGTKAKAASQDDHAHLCYGPRSGGCAAAEPCRQTWRANSMGSRWSAKTSKQSLTEIAGLGPYQNATYSFVKKDGAEGVRVDVLPKTFAPPLLDTGINIEGSETANIRFGMGARFTFLNFGRPNSELRTDVTIGLNNSVSARILPPARILALVCGPARLLQPPSGRCLHGQNADQHFESSRGRRGLRLRAGGQPLPGTSRWAISIPTSIPTSLRAWPSRVWTRERLACSPPASAGPTTGRTATSSPVTESVPPWRRAGISPRLPACRSLERSKRG